MKKSFLLLFFACRCILISLAQPGTLDSSFGNDGIVIGTYQDTIIGFEELAILSDDRIVNSAHYYVSSKKSDGILLERHYPDGTLDAAFGVHGSSFIFEGVTPSGLAIQQDGKIVLTGFKYFNRTPSLIISRFLPDGRPDSTFATNGLYIDMSGNEQYGEDIAIQQDGKIIVCGSWYKAPGLGIIYPILFRLNSNGSPDLSFGENGTKAFLNFTINNWQNKIALQTDGKIVTGGWVGTGGNGGDHFFLARYTADGLPDESFGKNAEVITDFDIDGEYINDLLIQPDGKILVVGSARANGFPLRKSYMAVSRYNTDGNLDESFGNGGKAKAEFDYASQSNSVTLQENGKIVLSGWVSNNNGNFALARLLENGILDSAFGENGKIITDLGTVGDESLSVGLQKNGKIVAGGITKPSNGNDNVALTRYLGDPTKTRPTIAQIKRWIRNHILHFEDANTNAAYYVIEKSTVTNGVFVPVTKIAVNAATYNYSYTLPEAASQSTYRIKAVNKDNSITYSSPISSSDPAKAGVATFKVYPNPAKDRITVETYGTMQLRLQNSNGRVLLTQTVNGKGSINISKLPNGIYYVVNTVNGESLKVVKE